MATLLTALQWRYWWIEYRWDRHTSAQTHTHTHTHTHGGDGGWKEEGGSMHTHTHTHTHVYRRKGQRGGEVKNRRGMRGAAGLRVYE